MPYDYPGWDPLLSKDEHWADPKSGPGGRTDFSCEHAKESIEGTEFTMHGLDVLRQAAQKIAAAWRGAEKPGDNRDVAELKADIGDTIFLTPHEDGIWTEVIPPVVATPIGHLDYMLTHEGLFGGLYACLGGNDSDTDGAITMKAFCKERQIVLRTIALDEGRAWMRKERKRREQLQGEIMRMEMPLGKKMQKNRIGRRLERFRPPFIP